MKTLKYAMRFLMRSKSYTVINLLGLAFSLACCIILLRYVHRELTVNTHCIDREHIYVPVINMEGNRGASAIGQMGKDSTIIDPQCIDCVSSMIALNKEYVVFEKKRTAANVIVTDSIYFRLFRYPVVQGSLSLSTPQSAVLSEAFARKLFGKESPIGKVLRCSNDKEVTVEGVLGEPENKTSIQFDVVLSLALTNAWNRMPIEFYSFTSAANLDKLNQSGAVPRYINPHASDVDGRQYTFALRSVEDLYWDSEAFSGNSVMFSWGSRSHLAILIGVGTLLLLTGILNFINIYMVAMLRRGKEYGLKKVFGASGKSLFMQIFIENLLLTVVALATAWLLVEITAVPVERLFKFRFGYTAFDWQLSLAILVLLPLITSIYPFLKFNYAPPIASIRSIGWGNRSVRSRMAFLFIQYVFTFLLIVLSLYSNDLLKVLLNTEPGFRTKDVILAQLVYESNDESSYTEEKIQARLHRVKQIDAALSACPDIEKWEASYANILIADYGVDFVNNRNEVVNLNIVPATPNFFNLYNIKFVEGRIPENLEENGYQSVWVANRSAMKALNYETCQGAMAIEATRKRNNAPLSPIVAVVEDYYGGHLSLGKRPTIFQVSSRMSGDNFQIACVPGKKKEVLDYLRKLELEVYGSEDFQYSILEEDIKAIYDKDRQVTAIYSIFAGIAIAVSGLGLFGISLFDIRQRYREIAIRKVNGAQLKDLYSLLLGKYVAMLGCAFAFTAPIAYCCIREYTKDFAEKAPVSVSIFAIGFVVVAFISLGTLIWQLRKAVNIDPAKIIKTE